MNAKRRESMVCTTNMSTWRQEAVCATNLFGWKAIPFARDDLDSNCGEFSDSVTSDVISDGPWSACWAWWKTLWVKVDVQWPKPYTCWIDESTQGPWTRCSWSLEKQSGEFCEGLMERKSIPELFESKLAYEFRYWDGNPRGFPKTCLNSAVLLLIELTLVRMPHILYALFLLVKTDKWESTTSS